MVAFIHHKLRAAPATSAARLRSFLQSEMQVDVSRQLVSLVIASRLKMSWKRTRKRGVGKQTYEERRHHFQTFKNEFIAAYANGTLAACDESGFDQRARPIYAYAPKGQPALLALPPSKAKHVHYSLVLAAHMDGSTFTRVLEKGVKGDRFADYVSDMTFPPGTVLILDNASIHKCKLVRQAAASKGYTILHPPSYTPEFNPVEMMFGVTKNAFYRDRYKSGYTDNMPACIERCTAEGARPANVRNCFSHVATVLSSPDLKDPLDALHAQLQL